MQCAIHPATETHVSCGKCGTPICYQCMVETPVGHRCPNCARVRPNPLRTLSFELTVKAVGAGIAAAALVAIGWALVKEIDFLGGFLMILLALGSGYLIAEAVSLAANRRPAPSLPWIAGVCAVAAFLFGNVLDWVFWTNAPFRFALEQWDNFEARGFTWNVLSLLLSVAMAIFRFR
jgi:hypothetical protein